MLSRQMPLDNWPEVLCAGSYLYTILHMAVFPLVQIVHWIIPVYSEKCKYNNILAGNKKKDMLIAMRVHIPSVYIHAHPVTYPSLTVSKVYMPFS